MITGELRSKIDQVWNAFWAGGIANPLEVIEQITYLLFMRGLDDAEQLEENRATRTGQPMRRRIFPEGKDGIGEDGGVAYADMRWSRLKNRDAGTSPERKAPHIAISVDMLDTGIDVPEVVNLVFFKQVRSKTKFWQMMGRGTRLCPDLFGPGQDKEFFRVFDYCQNLEFFGANPEIKEASAAKSLSARLFAARLDLVRALDAKHSKADGFAESGQETFDGPGEREDPPSEEEVRAGALSVLRETIAGLNLDNFIVRQKRRTVEKYRNDATWSTIDDAARDELVSEIAPLPSSRELGTEEAKRFDLLMFQLELALLRGSRRFDALKKELLAIASALEDQTAIPGIAAQARSLRRSRPPNGGKA